PSRHHARPHPRPHLLRRPLTHHAYHPYPTRRSSDLNSQVTALLCGASITLYDGNPGYPDMNVLWRLVDETEVTFFGGGAAYFMGCKKAGVTPKESFALSHLRAIGSTGSPLPKEDYHWIHDAVGEHIFIVA